MTLLLLALLGSASAAELEHQLTWKVMIEGQPVGRRTLTVKYLKGDIGMRRVMESWTELDGTVGPLRMRYRQRLTGHAEGATPASFQSVIDDGGSPREVQGRWTPSAWWVATTADGRTRTVEMPINRIDLSTVDLFDPGSAFSLAHYPQVRILSAETGEVLQGPVEELGISELVVGGEAVQVSGYAWDSPQGRSTFHFSADGFLVHYETQLLGITMEAELEKPPPGGVDDFPVAMGRAAIEEIDL